MKKILILVFLLAGAAGAAIYFSRLSSSPVTAEYYADYLPADTLATVNMLDLKGLTDTFPGSPLGKFLARPTIHGIVTELGGQPDALNKYDKIYDRVAGVMTNPAFRQIFGDDAVVAVLPPDVVRLHDDAEQEVQKSLLVFGTSSVSGALDSFARLVMSKKVSRESVDGLDITRVQLDDNEVIYGYDDGNVLVLAYDPANLAAAVNRKHTGGDSLHGSAVFAAAKKIWAESACGREYYRTYVNSVEIRALLLASNKEEARKIADYFQGFKGIGSVLFDREDELHFATRVAYDFDSLNGLVQKQYRAVSEENLSLGLLTPQVLAYYWVSLIDRDFIKGLLSAGDEEQYKKVDMIQRESGLSLDKITAAVGPQTGLVLNQIVNTGMFPLPRVVFYLQVRDHDIALQIVGQLRKKIADRGITTERSEKVNGHTIYFWNVLPGEATQPAFVLTDNMIYVANGKSTLAALLARGPVLDVLPEAMADILGDDLVKNVTSSNYTTFVLRPDRLATEVRDAADWLSRTLTATKGVSAEKLKEEILKLMHSVDVVTSTSDIQKDYVESNLVLKRAGAKPQNEK